MLETVANIATIFLVMQGLIILVVVTALSIGLAKAMMVVRQKTVQVMPQIQGQARRLATTTDSVSQKVASPFIGLNARQERFRGMRRRVFGGGQRQPGNQQYDPKE
jgi:cell shape-determining protein MreC